MRVLIDIVHPADVLFFHRPIDRLLARGDEVKILARKKDVTTDLLKRFGREFETISAASTGLAGLGLELVRRDAAMAKHVWKWRPDVMIGFGGVSISHCGALFSVPSISFYDTEGATMQTRLTWPFISRLYVPDSYYAATPRSRTRRLPGTKDLSYLHPDQFKPDYDIALGCGLDQTRDNYFLRLVSWRANHDLGKTGMSGETLKQIVDYLSRKGAVHISSESPLPEHYERFRYNGNVAELHHLLAHCQLSIGESTTMASESVMLGVPTVFAGRDNWGYVLELIDEGLIHAAAFDSNIDIIATIDHALGEPPELVVARRNAYVADKPDWADAIIDAIDEFRPAMNKSGAAFPEKLTSVRQI